MSNFAARVRSRFAAVRRARAIERALGQATSPEMRHEIQTIAFRGLW
jgi:hypothetical protein